MTPTVFYVNAKTLYFHIFLFKMLLFGDFILQPLNMMQLVVFNKNVQSDWNGVSCK